MTTGTLIVGTNTANGKGNVTAYLGYQNTEAVLAGQHRFRRLYDRRRLARRHNLTPRLRGLEPTTTAGSPSTITQRGYAVRSSSRRALAMPDRHRHVCSVHRRDRPEFQLRRAELPAASRTRAIRAASLPITT